jgi:uncharacterized protein (TIGR02246 family)
MTDTTDLDSVLIRTLDSWADGVRRHEPERVATYFTEDAIFQGFDRTNTVGRPGVAAYYDKQPVGLTPTFTVIETRPLAADAFLAYVDVDFTRPTGEVIPVHLTIVLVRSRDAWLIQHYHVSKIEA